MANTEQFCWVPILSILIMFHEIALYDVIGELIMQFLGISIMKSQFHLNI